MIIVSAPPPKRRGFATTWLPWIVFGGLLIFLFMLVNAGMEDERSKLPGETADFLGAAIRANGFNCPIAQRSYPQPEDAFGKVSKITCSNGIDYRFTWLAANSGYRVQPWR